MCGGEYWIHQNVIRFTGNFCNVVLGKDGWIEREVKDCTDPTMTEIYCEQ